MEGGKGMGRKEGRFFPYAHFYKSAPMIMKTDESWCLRCGLTDFDDIWHGKVYGSDLRR